jgi:hypothetical protein
MKFVTGIEDGRRIVAAVEDVPVDYLHALVVGSDFVADPAGGRFVWEYPPDAPGWEEASRNWEDFGAELFDQKHGVLPVDWEAGLLWIGDILDGMDADWTLVGSAALAVRGIDVSPGNLDVVVDEASADRLAPHIGAGVLRPMVDTDGWVVATRMGLLFHGCGITVLGGVKDQERPTPWDSEARAHAETVVWGDRTIRVPPLQRQLRHARAMFRNDHVRAIVGYRAGLQG